MVNNVSVIYADEKVIDMYYEVEDLYYEKSYEECLKTAKKMLEYYDSHMEVYMYAMTSAYNIGDYELSYQYLKLMLEKNPNNHYCLYIAAGIASILDKEDECIQYIKHLVSLDATFKSIIKNDRIFDNNNIRNNEEYRRIMEITVEFGGEIVEFDVAPMVIEGRTMLPMRKVFECMGAEVTYDEEAKRATAKKDDMEIVFTIDNQFVKVNGVYDKMDVPAMVVNGRTLVPVRFVAEALKAEVLWDEDNEIVSIMMPMEHGTGDLSVIGPILEEKIAVSVVDGMFPEPYMFDGTEGYTMIIFKEEEALNLFSTLSYDDKLTFIEKVTYDNYALVVGCSPVLVDVVYNGRIYYTGIYDYYKGVSGLNYYSNGRPGNIVKQYKESMNYKDFYLLPVEEQTTSKIGD